MDEKDLEAGKKPEKRYLFLGYYNPKQMMGGGVWALNAFDKVFEKLGIKKKPPEPPAPKDT